MTETEEFNRESVEQWDMTADNRDIEFMYEKDEFEAYLYRTESNRRKKRTLRSVVATAAYDANGEPIEVAWQETFEYCPKCGRKLR